MPLPSQKKCLIFPITIIIIGDSEKFIIPRREKVLHFFLFMIQCLEDYSLSEVAEELNISRQGVHDMIRRCDKALEGYEEKLHLVEKFVNIRGQVQKIHELASGYHADDIEAISNVILEEL